MEIKLKQSSKLLAAAACLMLFAPISGACSYDSGPCTTDADCCQNIKRLCTNPTGQGTSCVQVDALSKTPSKK